MVGWLPWKTDRGETEIFFLGKKKPNKGVSTKMGFSNDELKKTIKKNKSLVRSQNEFSQMTNLPLDDSILVI